MEQKQKLTPHGLRVQKNRNLFKRMFTSEIQTSLKVIINSRGHESQQPRQRSFFFQWRQGTPVFGCQPGPEQGLKQWQYQVGPVLWRWSLTLFNFQIPTTWPQQRGDVRRATRLHPFKISSSNFRSNEVMWEGQHIEAMPFFTCSTLRKWRATKIEQTLGIETINTSTTSVPVKSKTFHLSHLAFFTDPVPLCLALWMNLHNC